MLGQIPKIDKEKDEGVSRHGEGKKDPFSVSRVIGV